MNIARATGADILAIAEIMARSPLLRRYGVTKASARASLREGLRKRDMLLVAHGDEDIVGLAWVITTRALDRAAYLRLLLVAEGQQSVGVGARLLADAERRSRASGCRHLVLLVTTTNRRARAFYARHGYRHVGNLPGFVRPAIGESLYVKSW
jgi:ribosomal protein S18 acetylase RimI-like enzyme